MCLYNDKCLHIKCNYILKASFFRKYKFIIKTITTIRVVYLKCHFLFFDKLKCEIRNKVLIFVFILKWRHKNIKQNGFSIFKIQDIEIHSNFKFVFCFYFHLKNEKPNLLKHILVELVTISPYVITINNYKKII